MIQRSQSIYLLIAVILIILMFFFPLAELLTADGQLYCFDFDGIWSLDTENKIVLNTIPVAILISIISLISLISIFLFRKRLVQIRLSIFNMVLMLGLCGMIYFYVYYASKELVAKAYYSITCVFPVISIILTYLAIRAIKKDEGLIRSLDRIR